MHLYLVMLEHARQNLSKIHLFGCEQLVKSRNSRFSKQEIMSGQGSCRAMFCHHFHQQLEKTEYLFSVCPLQWQALKFRLAYTYSVVPIISTVRSGVNSHIFPLRLLSVAFWKIITTLKSHMTCYNLNLNSLFTSNLETCKQL